MAVDVQAQSMYNQFADFALRAAKETTLVATEHHGLRVAPKSKFDFVGNIGRSAASKAANDAVRSDFKNSILGMFGVKDVEDLPDSVKSAMKLDDYGKGKPLTARRILAVKTAVDDVLAAKAQPLMAAAEKEDIPLNDTMKKLIFAAVGACIDDQDVLDLVAKCISGVLRYEHKTLSSFEVSDKIESVKGRVRAMVAYVDELRQAAGTNADVYAEGLRLLGRQNGRVMQPGACSFMAECIGELQHAANGNQKVYAEGLRFLQEDKFWSLEPEAISRMVASVMDLDVKDVGLLTPNATARDIQKAAISFSALLDKAMRASGVDRITTPSLKEDCRMFLANMILAKALGDGVSVKDVQSALETGTASKLKRLYVDSAAALRSGKDETVVYFNTRDLDGASVQVASRSDKLRLGQRQRMADEVDAQLKLLDQLKEAVDLSCDGNDVEPRPIVPYGKPLVQAEVDPEFEAMGFIADKAFGKMEADQKAFISGSVKGKGRSADEMRFIFERKIMDVQPYKTGEAIQERCQATIKGMLRKSVADGCKMFAQGKGMADFADAIRGTVVTLPGNVKLSQDPKIARDQIAAFVANDSKKDFQSLSAEEKNKVYTVMALLSQGTAQAAFDGPGLALDVPSARSKPMQDKTLPAFVAVGDAKSDSKHASIELGKDGLKITFRGHRNIRQLQTRPGLEKVQSRQTVEKMTLSQQLEEDGGLLVNDVGEDSALDVEFSFRIRTKELDRLAGANFLDKGFRVTKSGTTCRDFKMTLTVNG